MSINLLIDSMKEEMEKAKWYKSPIEIIESQMRMEMEGEIYRAVQNYGINVDKEELLKALAYDRDQYEKGYDDGYDAGYNANKWIPCSERLPEEHEHVLVCIEYKGKYNVVGYYDKEFGWYCQWGAYVFNQVVAWMPLPKPYEMKGE